MTTEKFEDGVRPLPVTMRGKRSRQSLLDGAKRVFSDVGFSEARIVDITASAGAASGSFYTYFSSKEEIFVALLRELEDELRSPGHRGADHTEEPFEQIRRANLAYLASYRENAAVMVVWEQVATLDAEVEALRHDASLRFAGRIQHAIATWQEDGRVAATLDAALASVALTGMVSNFAYRWCAQGDDYDLDHAADQLSRLWAGALGLPVPD
ncbi:TetR/AcrR family transcriptional regulator [Nocardioides sp. Root190]|uniref:TetR/AcrR family transcriptional regulator n=1 Tax=Nocardioides sp. Root190 TaxID=1736488 RepID=UPI000A530947|nr:TetR/AcrR family transcriptional regulator [Nocardioides sp. Root190]